MTRFRLWTPTAVFFAASAALTAQEAANRTSTTDLRGIYVDSNAFPIPKANETALSAALTVPGVDGLVLVLGWDGIEPSMGQYQWNTLDQWIGTAVSLGKKVELSIRADFNTPAWLFQPAPGGGGARAVSFSFTRKPTDTTCLSETIAAPWDTAFLARWDSLLAAVSAHLKSAGTYDAVTILRLTGVNKDSDELHLPALSSSAPCATDAVATWQQAGYRPSLLLQGWDGTTSAFKRSFPDKFFSVAIIAETHPFPAIAEDGSVITGAIPNQNMPLLTLASQKFPGHLVIQNNSLYPDLPAQPETIQSAQTLGTLIAFQTNEDISGQGAACGGRGETTPCTAASFLNMLETGIYPLGKGNTLRAQYIEVFALNVNAFPDQTERAHLELIGLVGGCPSPDTTLCIDDQPGDKRFRVQVAFRTSQGGGLSGSGHAIPLAPVGVTRGGAFWFFSPDNPEMLAKVLDGCAGNGQRWFFASAGTNVGFTATVLDTASGRLKTYTNPDLTAAEPILDTSFESCASPSFSESKELFSLGPVLQSWFERVSVARSGLAPCAAGATTLCIDGTTPGDGRFKVEVSYQTSQGGGLSGKGHAIPLAPVGIGHGGAFWFFSADNPEMLVKVVDGCANNAAKWFFASAGTNVGMTVTVTDTTTGAQKTYTNADLNPARPIQDTAALRTCP